MGFHFPLNPYINISSSLPILFFAPSWRLLDYLESNVELTIWNFQEYIVRNHPLKGRVKMVA